MKRRINETHMRNGVTIVDPDNTYIGPDVKIAADVYLHPGTVLKGIPPLRLVQRLVRIQK